MQAAKVYNGGSYVAAIDDTSSRGKDFGHLLGMRQKDKELRLLEPNLGELTYKQK